MNINSVLIKDYENDNPPDAASTNPILPGLKRQLYRIYPSTSLLIYSSTRPRPREAPHRRLPLCPFGPLSLCPFFLPIFHTFKHLFQRNSATFYMFFVIFLTLKHFQKTSTPIFPTKIHLRFRAPLSNIFQLFQTFSALPTPPLFSPKILTAASDK
jgi:hypothetical protein